MSIEVMKQALAKFESLWEIGIDAVYKVELLPEIKALRQAIEQAEQIEPDLPPVEIGVDVTEHGTTVMAFYRRPNAVMEMFYSQFHPQPKQPKNPSIRIQNHYHTDHPMQHWDRTCPACVADSEPLANPIANQPETSGSPMPVTKYDSIELHVLHSHLAGMLYDFMGWLTSRRTRLCLSDSDNASPAVDAIVDFAKMRGLRLEDAQVEDWQAILTTPTPPPMTPEHLPQYIATDGKPMESGGGGVCSRPRKQWVELNLDDIPDVFVGDISFCQGAKWAQTKLKEKNT